MGRTETVCLYLLYFAAKFTWCAMLGSATSQLLALGPVVISDARVEQFILVVPDVSIVESVVDYVAHPTTLPPSPPPPNRQYRDRVYINRLESVFCIKTIYFIIQVIRAIYRQLKEEEVLLFVKLVCEKFYIYIQIVYGDTLKSFMYTVKQV